MSLPRDYKYGTIKHPTRLKKEQCKGYYRVTLFKKGHRDRRLVHRIVAEHFIPNPEKLPCINHKDEIKTNNSVSNLEWCTHKYNSNYGTNPERISKSNWKPVIQTCKQGRYIKTWPSMTKASEELNISLSEISVCTRKPHLSAGGYKWRYVK